MTKAFKPKTDPSLELSDETLAELAPVFRALGEPTRLRIVSHIRRQGMCNVAQLCQRAGLSQPLVSHHLAQLRMAGVLQMERKGRCHYYTIDAQRFEQLMRAIAPAERCSVPCDRFLECMLG